MLREIRENVLASKTVTLKTLQRFAGKAVSFSLAIAACKLYLVLCVIPSLLLRSLVFSNLSWNIGDFYMTGRIVCRGDRRDISLPLCIVTLPSRRGEAF